MEYLSNFRNSFDREFNQNTVSNGISMKFLSIIENFCHFRLFNETC